MRRVGTWKEDMPAFRSVVSVLLRKLGGHAGVPLRRVRAVEEAGRLFSTPSRPALRAAACGGRPRAGSDTTVTREPASPSTQADPAGFMLRCSWRQGMLW
jgi:hypothetical protein